MLRQVPDVSVTTLDGETLHLARRTGEVLVVNFWATWCPPCRVEIPDLISLHEELHGAGLTVLGIAVDEGEEVVQPFVEEQGINYPIVVDDGRIADAFGGVYGLPTTYVINPDGEVIHRTIGLFPIDEIRPQLEAMTSTSFRK